MNCSSKPHDRRQIGDDTRPARSKSSGATSFILLAWLRGHFYAFCLLVGALICIGNAWLGSCDFPKSYQTQKRLIISNSFTSGATKSQRWLADDPLPRLPKLSSCLSCNGPGWSVGLSPSEAQS